MSRSCTSRFAAQLPEKYLAERAGFLEHADGGNHYMLPTNTTTALFCWLVFETKGIAYCTVALFSAFAIASELLKPVLLLDPSSVAYVS